MDATKDSTAYYFDDITLMPARFIWRAVRRSSPPLMWLPTLLYFVWCKIRRVRPVPNYGSPRPIELVDIPWESLPEIVQTQIRPAIVECETSDFGQANYYRTLYIGAKEGYSAILLHKSGYSYASVASFTITRGTFSKSKTVFSCHSQRTTGTTLVTGSISPEDWHPEIVPPGKEVVNVWPENSHIAIIRAHLKRTDVETGLVRFDAIKLRDHILATSQQVFDFMVNKGYFMQLTEEEVARLCCQKN